MSFQNKYASSISILATLMHLDINMRRNKLLCRNILDAEIGVAPAYQTRTRDNVHIHPTIPTFNNAYQLLRLPSLMSMTFGVTAHCSKSLKEKGQSFWWPVPAKRTRKAAKRRCEIVLLRGVGVENALCLSTHYTHAPSASLNAPTAEPVTGILAGSSAGNIHDGLPTAPANTDNWHPRPFHTSPGSMHHPLAPPTSAGLPSPPPSVAPVTTVLASPELAPPEPAAPPLWPEAYILSTNLDQIMFLKCCKRNYNYKWYNHCSMCYMDEKKA
jgi:hypothetical protein